MQAPTKPQNTRRQHRTNNGGDNQARVPRQRGSLARLSV